MEENIQEKKRNTKLLIYTIIFVLLIIGVLFSIASWNDTTTLKYSQNQKILFCFLAFIGGVMLTVMVGPLIITPFILPYFVFKEAQSQQSKTDTAGNIGFVISFLISLYIAKTANQFAPIFLPLWLLIFFSFSFSLYAGILFSEYVKEMHSDPFDRTDPTGIVIFWLGSLFASAATIVFLGLFIKLFTQRSLL